MGPDFLCVGMQKAGTRWLHDQLRAVSGAWMPPIKEINYFNKSSFKPGNIKDLKKLSRRFFDFKNPHRALDRKFLADFERGLIRENYNDDWYFSLFANKGSNVSGDISPGYSGLNDVQVSSVAEKLPDTLVLLLLRHPVDRAKSAMSMYVRNGQLREEDIQSLEGVKNALSKKSISKHSYPSQIWQRWVMHFGSERCKYFFMEDIRDNPEAVRAQASEFIGLDSPKFKLPADFNRKAKNKGVPFPEEIEAYLYDYFRDEILKCQKIFQGHALNWTDRLSVGQ